MQIQMKIFGVKFCVFLICLQHVKDVKTEEVVEESITPPLHRSRRSAKLKPFVIEATELTQEQHQSYVDYHNLKRSQVQPPATNMFKLVFNQGLADLAKAYSRKCIYEHNPSPSTGRFSQPGENLHVTSSISSNLTSALQHGIYLWFKEKDYYTYDTMKCQKKKICGHYTEMVWAENKAVGCAITTCGNLVFKDRPKPRMQLTVCNYGPGGNFRGENPYRRGESCSECPNKDKCACAQPDEPTTKPPTTTSKATTLATPRNPFPTTTPKLSTTQKPNKVPTTTTKKPKVPIKPITTSTKKEVKTTPSPTKPKDPKDAGEDDEKVGDEDEENKKGGDGNGSSSISKSTFYVWFFLFSTYYALLSL